MPVMSGVEQAFCRSPMWRGFAAKVVLPWALQGAFPRGDVLELGSGSGAMAEATARRYPDAVVTATDVDPRMVAACQRRLAPLPNAAATRADVTDLRFQDQTFDLVASYLMLHHVVEWERALKEIARVLRPGGVFVGYDLDRTWLGELVHVIDRSPHRLISRAELGASLASADWANTRTRPRMGHLVIQFVALRAPGPVGPGIQD